MEIRWDRLLVATICVLMVCAGIPYLASVLHELLDMCVSAAGNLNNLVFGGSGDDHYRLAVLCVLLITFVALAKLLLRRGGSNAGPS